MKPNPMGTQLDRLTEKELSIFEGVLRTALAQAPAQLDERDADRPQAIPKERGDEADQANSTVAHGMRLRFKERHERYVLCIRQALARIKNGTFGDCIQCGEQIALPRLRAHPTATLCISCKELTENQALSGVHAFRRRAGPERA